MKLPPTRKPSGTIAIMRATSANNPPSKMRPQWIVVLVIFHSRAACRTPAIVAIKDESKQLLRLLMVQTHDLHLLLNCLSHGLFHDFLDYLFHGFFYFLVSKDLFSRFGDNFFHRLLHGGRDGMQLLRENFHYFFRIYLRWLCLFSGIFRNIGSDLRALSHTGFPVRFECRHQFVGYFGFMNEQAHLAACVQFTPAQAEKRSAFRR